MRKNQFYFSDFLWMHNLIRRKKKICYRMKEGEEWEDEMKFICWNDGKGKKKWIWES